MKLRLVGTFQLLDDQGRDLAPRGAKPRAILAMLALVPEGQRQRRWLESKLWSDRAPEQASGSLRQALMQIRKALGDAANCISADRESIRISGIQIDEDADLAALEAGREFLEGMDIPDSAFEDWLTMERAMRHKRIEDATGAPFAGRSDEALKLTLMPSGAAQDDIQFLSQTLANTIGSIMSEFVEVDVFSLDAGSPSMVPPQTGFTIAVDCLPGDGDVHYRLSVSSTANGKVFWSRQGSFGSVAGAALASDEFAQVVFQAADAAYGATASVPQLRDQEAWAASRIAGAVRAMFTFSQARMADAERLLTEVITHQPSARAYAWHGQMKQIMAVERMGDWNQLVGEADESARKALEYPDPNPLVFALTSQIRVMLDNDPDAGLSLARDAVAASPHNAFGHAAMCGAYLRIGEGEKALASARMGAQIAGRSGFAPWWQALAGLAAMSLNRYDDAIVHYQAAHARAPGFRAPMRHLYVLHQAAGRTDQASRVLAALLRQEPDFSMQLLRDDPTYPAATLRKSNLLQMALKQS